MFRFWETEIILWFQAQHPDELSIIESEQLEVIGEGDGDGWLRARNYKGQEGFVPHNYLDVERDEQVTNNPSLLWILKIFKPARTPLPRSASTNVCPMVEVACSYDVSMSLCTYTILH